MKYPVNASLQFNQLILLFLTSFLSIRSEFIILGIARAFHGKKVEKDSISEIRLTWRGNQESPDILYRYASYRDKTELLFSV